MSIYGDDRARGTVRAWCRARLDGQDHVVGRTELPTSLGTTHVTLSGSAGPTVVVLPAAGECAAVLDPLVAELATGHRVVAVDLPGEPGLSHDRRPHGDLVRRYGHWVDEVVEAVADGPVVVIGDGLGATVGLCARTGRIAGLAAVSPAGIDEYPGDLAFELRVLRHELAPSGRSAERVLRPLYGDRVPDDHDALVEWTALTGTAVWPSGPPALLPNAVLRDWRGVPHVVLVGERDPMWTAGRLERPVAALMGSAVRVVPGAGALVTHEAPDVVRAAVTGALATS
ncbi:hypothetical protein Ae168Ps1_0631c [Pseudonocardia sp. Ae168_Ps1]|uniref:alpha/beta fold hydrolase n=1 Tax=unclassified Pseudonocardia TaxID=2619320 RepID=UPI00094AF506|nr:MULTISPECIES: alpha/beta hydrolase [unclassified Pseudonocardia]OLL72255.1 hypothetical protein Ae150APs1_0633c [Pseudonocardia sp. Ae150A_Ps1]OLL78225.1 hypothetical protein Ae168Ps1_0631c [Pseudonocardia sp. Ae168_Ps1]OLL87653.1 hypothetical protein Ae263Ps1_4708 [Pseudonocardia sp. Ae263_Ps1]OLL92320.1 hypothetical protein Ae356Ps1_2217c [Pseudonocardia sp. Ae356_Ps1]